MKFALIGQDIPMLLPTLLAGFLPAGSSGIVRNLLEGVVRILIFLAFIIVTSKQSDIKRTYMYHGAEHKTIACYEKGWELTVDNIRRCSRFHPRCGTSFLFVVMIISILVFSVFTWQSPWVRMALRLLLLPLVVGISYEMGALIATLIFIIYTAASGLFGVVYTDVVQFFMLIIFVYLLIPASSIASLGGLGEFWANVDKSYITPYIDGEILGDIVTYLVFTMAGAEMWQRSFAAKDGKSAKRGMFWGTAVYAVTIVLLFAMGLAAQQILPNVVEEFGTADAVIPALAIKILPPGLTGLALSGILSVMMSTADSYLLSSATNLTNDIYVKYIRKDATDHEMQWAGRVIVMLISVVAFFIAASPNCGGIMALVECAWAGFGSAFGPVILLSLYWRRLTYSGAIAGVCVGFVVDAVWYAFLSSSTGLYEIIPGFLCGLIAAVIVSLCSKAPSKEVTDLFDRAFEPTD